MTKYTLQPSAQPFVQIKDGGPGDDRPIELREYLNIVAQHRGLVAAVAVGVMLLGTTYAFVKKPVYEGNMLIRVAAERSGESRDLMGNVSPSFETKTTAVSEIELLRSRQVVARVVDNLGLYIEARPKYLFLVGAKIAARNRVLSEPGLAGYGGYCWGVEKIRVAALGVPDSLVDTEFIVTAGQDGRFRLTGEAAHIDAWGSVGVPLTVASADGPLQLRITELSGRPGAQFLLVRRSRVSTIAAVQKALSVTELGKESGMINVTLRSTDPGSVQSLLGELGNEYLRQNQSRKSQDVEKSLSVLEAQLPEVKHRMELAEADYNGYRNRHGTADLAEETRLRLQQYAAAEQRLLELQQKRTDLATRFAEAHPMMTAIDSQIRAIVAENRSNASQIKQLPITAQELDRRAREVKANTELYTNLLRRSEELRLVSLDKSSGVRLVDAPVVPVDSVNPRGLIIGFSAALGIFLGVLSAFIKKMINE